MTVLLWLLVGTLGAALMIGASRAAVRHAVGLGEALRLPPFVLGFTVIALGTDLPEIVNSVVASSLGHGDINVGDSIGSVVVQGALVMGAIPFFARAPLATRGRDAAALAGMTIVLLALGLALVSDGMLSRLDGATLMLSGIGAVAVAWRALEEPARPDPSAAGSGGWPGLALRTLGALGLVGVGATALVWAVIQTAASFAAPEYLISFFVAALGTSLPELAVNVTALRRGQRELALAGVLGACLLDASVSISAGPLLFPTAVTFDLAWRGGVFAIVTMAAVGLLLGLRGVHDRRSGAALLALYLMSYVALLAGP